MDNMHRALPLHFCWTRFGTESGETIESILERKEGERRAHGGMFLWGIGNSVGPAVRELVRREQRPMVYFSPMRSRPKLIDAAPSVVLAWTRALTLSDEEWRIPVGLEVLSRGATDTGAHKRSHYALVCKSEVPLVAEGPRGELDFDELVNLLSQSRLGHSQVTAVVRRKQAAGGVGPRYPIGFAAELVFPYFVRLVDPVPAGPGCTAANFRRARQPLLSQQSLLPV